MITSNVYVILTLILKNKQSILESVLGFFANSGLSNRLAMKNIDMNTRQSKNKTTTMTAI
jgi:hypothetical protein